VDAKQPGVGREGFFLVAARALANREESLSSGDALVGEHLIDRQSGHGKTTSRRVGLGWSRLASPSMNRAITVSRPIDWVPQRHP
jgi:hypothetical protein